MGASCSSGLSSSGSSSSKGEEWTYKIYFAPEADKSSGAFYGFKNHELYTKLHEIEGTNEQIIKIFAYKHKLWRYQLTQAVLYHMFIVLETENWWWSFEKNTEGITLQRSKKPEAVKDKYRQTERNTITLIKQDEGRICIMDLFDWIEKELQNKYNWLLSNCQHFADGIYSRVTSDILAMFRKKLTGRGELKWRNALLAIKCSNSNLSNTRDRSNSSPGPSSDQDVVAAVKLDQL